ncbi:magnesium and cobalt transport protein CorA [Candidatus Woesearchaeota archaeon]|nr:MAG: magnesium and cobalt transport protein CorA [Candidatus Woesearchaeota archaeon]
MIEVKFFDGHGSVISTLENMSLKEKNILLDCVNPSKVELQLVAKTFGISFSDLEKGLDPEERPTIENFETYNRITISAPIGSNGQSKTISLSFFVGDNYLIILSKKKIPLFDKLNNLPKKTYDEAFGKDISHLLHFYMYQAINEYFHVIDEIEDEIDKIENKLFKNVNKSILKNIFSLKKTLIYFHKSLVANREVFLSIDKETISQIKKSDLKNYRNLYFDINQLIDMVGTHREILTGSMDIYMSAVSNNLNEVMKKLTVYASYIMVPTLISGIYGMNFQHLPEIYWKYGYFFALGLMGLSVLAIRNSFKKKGWI